MRFMEKSNNIRKSKQSYVNIKAVLQVFISLMLK